MHSLRLCRRHLICLDLVIYLPKWWSFWPWGKCTTMYCCNNSDEKANLAHQNNQEREALTDFGWVNTFLSIRERMPVCLRHCSTCNPSRLVISHLLVITYDEIEGWQISKGLNSRIIEQMRNFTFVEKCQADNSVSAKQPDRIGCVMPRLRF